MATKLEKDITRESTIEVDERNIMVTLTADQKIKFKLKGLRTGEVSIDIKEIYNDLAGLDEPKQKTGSINVKRTKKEERENPTIELYDLRSKSAIDGHLTAQEKAKFDQIILGLIKEARK